MNTLYKVATLLFKGSASIVSHLVFRYPWAWPYLFASIFKIPLPELPELTISFLPNAGTATDFYSLLMQSSKLLMSVLLLLKLRHFTDRLSRHSTPSAAQSSSSHTCRPLEHSLAKLFDLFFIQKLFF